MQPEHDAQRVLQSDTEIQDGAVDLSVDEPRSNRTGNAGLALDDRNALAEATAAHEVGDHKLNAIAETLWLQNARSPGVGERVEPPFKDAAIKVFTAVPEPRKMPDWMDRQIP